MHEAQHATTSSKKKEKNKDKEDGNRPTPRFHAKTEQLSVTSTAFSHAAGVGSGCRQQ